MPTLAEIQAELKRRDSEAKEAGEYQAPWLVPCSRYEVRGDDQRVRFALGYACAILRSWAWVEKIIRLHDHKGILHVIYSKPLTLREKRAVSDAWQFCWECEVEYEEQDSRAAAITLSRSWGTIMTKRELTNMVRHNAIEVENIIQFLK